MTLEEQFGNIDVYLFDQLLRGRVRRDRPVLDAGCGNGRNLVYLIREGFDVHAVDRDPAAVRATRSLAERLTPDLAPGRFRVEDLEHLSLSDASCGTVISNAVLHFARNRHAFDRMVAELWRVLCPGGMLFARLASSIGIERTITPLRDGWYRLPDGTDRFLVSEQDLMVTAERLGGTLVDPIKTTNVQGLRCMTTWCLAKRGAS